MKPTEVIRSRDNPLVKELRRLAQDGAAYRKTGRVWIEGEHLCEAAALRGVKAELLVLSEEKTHLALAEYARSATKTVVLEQGLMHSISALESASGVGMVLSLPSATSVESGLHSVVLDRLQDPGNAGSILRSAAAFGFVQVIALKGSVALWSPKVLRAGMGAHFSLRIVEGASLEQLAAARLPLAVTSSHRGQYLHALAHPQLLLKEKQGALIPRGPLAGLSWIFGHEGQGVSTELEALAQAHVRIAQPGGQESLNVAAAAAICLHAGASARMDVPL
jgi:RNA methyltransferase, TrmH family